MLDWIVQSYLEILGTVSGLLYIYLSIKQKMALWLVGILSSVLYVFVFFHSHLYADMTLNMYYFIVSIYGWYHWYTSKNVGGEKALPMIVLSIRGWAVYLLVAGVLTVCFTWILSTIPQKIGWESASLPFWDGLLTAASVVATWMLARKILEQWLWWIVIDALSIGIFIYKHLYFTVGLFAVYTVMAVVGYLEWKKDNMVVKEN
jgi:nicotinamide mononucleotide transporter